MKKVFLTLLVAGMFVACGNKTAETETTDSTAVETTEVENNDDVAVAPTATPVTTPATTQKTAPETTQKEEKTPVADAQPAKEKIVTNVVKKNNDKVAKEAIKDGAKAGSDELKNTAKKSQTR